MGCKVSNIFTRPHITCILVSLFPYPYSCLSSF